MAMLNSLVIKNFRMLEDFSVEKLGRVNLIVGKNNSGKSTVLEALRIYAKGYGCNASQECSHSYEGSFNAINQDIYLGEDGNSLVKIDQSIFKSKTNCSFIPTQFVSIKELKEDWKNIELSDDEDIVTRALQIIVPNYQRLAFYYDETDFEELNPFVKVKLSHLSKAIPLSSLGDGMLRILQIAIKLVSAQGGFLLIDEFENGLHYSVQENVWRLLFEMAEKLDIQVFATTHSWDCVQSFNNVAIEKENTEAMLIHMGKSARKSNYGQIIASVYDKNELQSMTQADIEVR